MGQVYQDAQNYAQSELMYIQALKTFVPPDVALAVFAPKGKPLAVFDMTLPDVKTWYQTPVHATHIVLDPNLQSASGVLYNLSSMYCEVGQVQKAENILKRCAVAAKVSKATSVEQEEKMFLLFDLLIQQNN